MAAPAAAPLTAAPLTAAPLAPPRSPRREIARIAAPVSAEFVLTLLLNVVGQVVVGTLGATAIAAVGFANSLTVIVTLTLGGLGTSVTILVARAHGAGRQHETSRVVTGALAVGGLVSLGVTLAPLVAAQPLLRLVGASATVAEAGAGYFRLATLATVPTLLVAVLSGLQRAAGHARGPMAATLVTVVVNTVLGFALVLGLGPMPRLGVAGAGLATLVAALVKVAIVATQVYGVHRLARWETPRRGRGWAGTGRSLVVLAVPLAVTALFYTVGTFLYNVVLQQLGDDALAAGQIVATLEQVFVVASIGLMTAATALVGREIGRGDPGAAAAWVLRVRRAGVATGLLFGGLFASSVLLLPLLFPGAGADVRAMAAVGIVVNAVAQVVKVRNMILGAGVLPSGGDVRGVILGDVVSAFAVGLPLAVTLGLHTPLGVLGVFVARVIEECAKVLIFSWRSHRLRWDEVVAAQG